MLCFISKAGDGDAGGEAATVLHDIAVPMRDGVELAVDVYLPPAALSAGARFPVILERTPYGKHLPSRSERNADNPVPLSRAAVARFFVRHGYVVVYQDCRGRYRSGGQFKKYVNEGEDGYDTCAWILRQPWCNGRIGTKGLSYAAHTQAALGSLGAPGVVAMFMDSGGFSNAYQNGIRQGGAFELKQLTWGVGHARESPEVVADPARLQALDEVDVNAWLARIGEWQPGHSPLSAAPEYEAYVFEQWRHAAFDAYWRRPGLYAAGYYERFGAAATMHMSSWYDPYARSACDNYLGLKHAGAGPTALVLGPWIHGNRFQTYAGDVDFGPAATLDGNLAPDYLNLRLQWFEQHLKHTRAAPAQESPVRIFVMGGGSGLRDTAGRMQHGGHWRTEHEWPLARTQYAAWYLHADGQLNPLKPRARQAACAWTYDPDQPTPTRGGAVTSGEPYMFGGAFDQGPANARTDQLSFESTPLSQDLELTGPIVAHLWVSSDCLDTDVCFKLIDVMPPNADYPDGYAMNLTDGILRLRYRDSWEQPTLLEPGRAVAVRIEALPTSNVFKRGHRIRVDITSSNFPRYDPNPNTGAADGYPGPRKLAHNQLWLDRDHPSHLVLPVIPV